MNNLEVMSVEDFGAALIRTGDLDPIYVMLNDVDLPWEQKARWSLAYWCFYHAGFASYASEQQGNNFWNVMSTAARNDASHSRCPATEDGRWPRGTERRHFRGKASVNSIDWLFDHYPRHPEDAVRWLAFGEATGATLSFRDVTKRVKEWPAFGPWIAFKVADMLDAVLGYSVDFTDTEQDFFDDPKEGARIVWEKWGEKPADSRGVLFTGAELTCAAVNRLLRRFHHEDLRPMGLQRHVKVQEIETVLCKYKAHTRGFYPVGKDTKEIIHGLEPWASHSLTAFRCMNALKQIAAKATAL